MDSGIYVGTSHQHSYDTYKILIIIKGKIAGKVVTRRHVYFNERSFPARKMTPQRQKSTIFQQKDDGSELIGLTFIDDGESFHVTGTHKEDGQIVVDYKDKKGTDHYSTIHEVRQWIAQTALNQAANAIQPTRTSYINKLAE